MGYALSFDNELISTIKENQGPWTVNLIADIAARFLLKDEDYINKTISFVNKEKIFLFHESGFIPCHQDNFAYMDAFQCIKKIIKSKVKE